MTDEYHPELAGYDPGEERPRRHPAMAHVTRVVVIIGILALVLPGVIISIATAANTADVSCGIVVSQLAPDSVAYAARFELIAPGGPGWYCYAQDFDGTEILLSPLGLIPEVRGGVAVIPT